MYANICDFALKPVKNIQFILAANPPRLHMRPQLSMSSAQCDYLLPHPDSSLSCPPRLLNNAALCV